MLNAYREEQLAPDVEQVLQARLAVWGTQHRLAAPQMAAIRQQIMREAQVESAELPYEWWQHFFADWSAALQRSLDNRPILQASQNWRIALQYVLPHP
jgi:hypothetical protein